LVNIKINILVLLPHMVCNTLVAGGRRSGAGQQAMRPGCADKHYIKYIWNRLCSAWRWLL